MNSRLIFLILSICTFTLISTLLSLPNTTLPPDCKRCTSLKNKFKKKTVKVESTVGFHPQVYYTV